jgi:hypothetical protein
LILTILGYFSESPGISFISKAFAGHILTHSPHRMHLAGLKTGRGAIAVWNFLMKGGVKNSSS